MSKQKVVVLGGTGVAGREIVKALDAAGYEAVSASRASGVDIAAGTGLDEAFAGAHAVVDAANSMKGAKDVLVTGTANAVDAAARAGVAHYVMLGIVGSDRVPMPYYKLKMAQEAVVREGTVPFTVLRATQFHQLVSDVIAGTGKLKVLPARKALIQPVDPRDVAQATVAVIAEGPSGDRAIAGPEVHTLKELARMAGAGRRLPVWIPGRAVRSINGGGLTDRTAPRGAITFRDWVAAR